MHCKGNSMGGRRIGWTGGSAGSLALLMAVMLVWVWGCSEREDNQPPEGKNRVVVAIKKPIPKPSPEEKTAQPVPEKKPEPVVVKEKETTAQVQSTPEAPVPLKPAPAKTPAEVKPSKKQEVPQPDKGFVQVRDGESLSAVAARKDVYGDFLQWPKLYRLNVERLSMIRTWQEVKKKPLPAGLSLRFEGPEMERPPFEGGSWVVTVRSWETPGKLAAPAIRLIESGYRVYIARALVNGKPWLRLRVGFYRTKSEALAAKEKIGELLGNNDAWIARAGKTEIEEFSKD
ncbi:MAG: hypothetical protein DRG82_12790 [Deltaproteobacteria bacterium]|nr:MAG: hypothetical protein DRG82_12790 [Deltaproteobacteria bacterium]